MSSRKNRNRGGSGGRGGGAPGGRQAESGSPAVVAEHGEMHASAAPKPADAAAGPAGSDGRWVIHDPAFEADATCPLMPVWPWGGHRGWSYDLVRFMRPRMIAELGVHWGTSLFAFAQAVKDAGLDSRMIGVDTWVGDNHTGPYGSEVLRTVRSIAEEFFPKQEFELLQMTFDEALSKVKDGSVDLIHIDGFHEYEAVEHDFESWLVKLAPDGVVLLHDVDKSTGYGSARYWQDLLSRYPGFAFEHSWGLGVVFPKGDRWLRALERENLKDKVLLYTYRARFQRTSIELKDTGEMAVTRLEAMHSMEGLIRARDGEIALLKQILSDRDNEIALLKGLVTERDQSLASAAARTTEIEARVAQLEATSREAVAQKAAATEEYARASALAAEKLQALSTTLHDLQEVHRGVTASLEQERARGEALSVDVRRLTGEVVSLSDAQRMLGGRLEDAERRQVSATSGMQAMMVRILEQEEHAARRRAEMEELAMATERQKIELEKVAADIEMLALRVEQLERLEIEREKNSGRAPKNGRVSAASRARPERQR